MGDSCEGVVVGVLILGVMWLVRYLRHERDMNEIGRLAEHAENFLAGHPPPLDWWPERGVCLACGNEGPIPSHRNTLDSSAFRNFGSIPLDGPLNHRVYECQACWAFNLIPTPFDGPVAGFDRVTTVGEPMHSFMLDAQRRSGARR